MFSKVEAFCSACFLNVPGFCAAIWPIVKIAITIASAFFSLLIFWVQI
jgi:hypothetical protein